MGLNKIEGVSHMVYRKDIDGLRAIAVLLVVGFHAFPVWVRGGFIGVDVFFVISGFLISKIISDQLDSNTFSFVDFYMRRVRRIFPALLTVLVVTYIFGYFLLLPDEYQQLGNHISAGAAFVSNLILWGESGYFDTASDVKPLLHLWSLGIEEQYYLIWPLILFVSLRFNLKRIGVILSVVAASFFLNIQETNSNPTGAFYSPVTRMWELAVGALLAWVMEKNYLALPSDSISHIALRFSRTKLFGHLASVLGAAFLAMGVILIGNKNIQSHFLSDAPSFFPGWWALFPTLGTALIILAGPRAIVNRLVLSNFVLVNIGLISYCLYLWHWPLLSFARIIEGDVPSRGVRILAVGLAMVLAWITYEFIERPIRFHQGKKKSVILVVMMISVGLLGLLTNAFNGFPGRESLKQVTLTEAVRDQFPGSSWKYSTNQDCLNRFAFKDIHDYGWWFCMKSSNAEPKILLLGHSYANQYYPGFASNKNIKGSVLSIGTCDPGMAIRMDIPPSSPCYGQRSKNQELFINHLVEGADSLKYIFIAGLDPNPSHEYITKIMQRINFFEKNYKRVVIFTPHLEAGFDPRSCFTTPFRKSAKDCSFDSTARDKLNSGFLPLIQEVKSSHPAVLFFEPNDVFCEGANCSFVRNGLPLLRDGGHMSEFGSLELQKHFSVWAEKHLPDIFKQDSL